MIPGEQLELFEGGPVSSRIPWGGRSPRALTRVALGLILKAQAAKSIGVTADPGQFEIWPERSKGGPLYEGSAPLLPLPWEGKNG